MKNIRERGFAIVEVIVVLIIVGALAGTGYWVYKQRTDDSGKTTTTSQNTSDGESIVAEAPEVEDTSDLQDAEAALDNTTLDESDEELDAQLNEF